MLVRYAKNTYRYQPSKYQMLGYLKARQRLEYGNRTIDEAADDLGMERGEAVRIIEILISEGLVRKARAEGKVYISPEVSPATLDNLNETHYRIWRYVLGNEGACQLDIARATDMSQHRVRRATHGLKKAGMIYTRKEKGKKELMHYAAEEPPLSQQPQQPSPGKSLVE